MSSQFHTTEKTLLRKENFPKNSTYPKNPNEDPLVVKNLPLFSPETLDYQSVSASFSTTKTFLKDKARTLL